MAHEPPEYYRKQTGDLIICTYGEFSDYTLDGVYRVTCAVDLAQEVRAWVDQLPYEKSYTWPGGYEQHYVPFACIRALLQRGILAPIPCAEIHFGTDSPHGMPAWLQSDGESADDDERTA